MFNKIDTYQNQDVEQMEIEMMPWPDSWPAADKISVNDTLTRVGMKMNRTLDDDEIFSTNFTDPLGAYYVYNIDYSTNDYSVAIYG